MKTAELRKLIREEVARVFAEASKPKVDLDRQPTGAKVKEKLVTTADPDDMTDDGYVYVEHLTSDDEFCVKLQKDMSSSRLIAFYIDDEFEDDHLPCANVTATFASGNVYKIALHQLARPGVEHIYQLKNNPTKYQKNLFDLIEF